MYIGLWRRFHLIGSACQSCFFDVFIASIKLDNFFQLSGLLGHTGTFFSSRPRYRVHTESEIQSTDAYRHNRNPVKPLSTIFNVMFVEFLGRFLSGLSLNNYENSLPLCFFNDNSFYYSEIGRQSIPSRLLGFVNENRSVFMISDYPYLIQTRIKWFWTIDYRTISVNHPQ